MQKILGRIAEILPIEGIKLTVKNIAAEITSDNDIAKLNKQLENTNEAKKSISNKIQKNLENDGFIIPQNFEKNPLGYIYFKIINFMKQKGITINLNGGESKYTSIKHKDIYSTTSINIGSLYGQVEDKDHEYIMSMIEKFKEIYRFNQAKSEIKEKIQKYKKYKKNTEFFEKHETVIIANKNFRSKEIKNKIKSIAARIEDTIYPTNHSKSVNIKQKSEQIKNEQIQIHKKIGINYIEINNIDQIIGLQNEIKSRQYNKFLKQYQQQIKIENQVKKEKSEYIKKIKILKLKLSQDNTKLEDLNIKIKEIEEETKHHKAKIQEYRERSQEIENKLNKKTQLTLQEFTEKKTKQHINKSKDLKIEKDVIQIDIIPKLEKKINNLVEDKSKILIQKKEIEINQNSNLLEQLQLKKKQNNSIKSKNKYNSSKIQAKLNPEISCGINHLQELVKYDNICIKFEEDNYNIYLDTSKKTYKDGSMYPMLENHHKPVIIASLSKEEFESISNLYPIFKKQINNQIENNAKNAFLSDRINSKNIINLN